MYEAILLIFAAPFLIGVFVAIMQEKYHPVAGIVAAPIVGACILALNLGAFGIIGAGVDLLAKALSFLTALGWAGFFLAWAVKYFSRRKTTK